MKQVNRRIDCRQFASKDRGKLGSLPCVSFFRNSFDPAERYLAVGLRCVSGSRFTEIESEDTDDE